MPCRLRLSKICRAGGLYQCIDFTGMRNRQYGMLICLSIPVHLLFLEGKELFSSMWRTHMKLSTPLFQIPKGNQICRNTLIYIKMKDRWPNRCWDCCRYCKQCNSNVKLAGGTSNMSKHMKHHQPLSSFLLPSSSFSNWSYSTFGSMIHW